MTCASCGEFQYGDPTPPYIILDEGKEMVCSNCLNKAVDIIAVLLAKH